VHPDRFSTDSLIAFAYLIFIGSLVAYTAYVWLLQNAPISKVATYAYVNPMIAIFLGWAILSEHVTVTTLVGAAVIVCSVAATVRRESG
jgi:drug/metabolite transporter (DMT)-like permease